MYKLLHNVGDIIRGQYQVLSRIKSGGMATVYKVRDVEIGALYACKEMDLVPALEDIPINRHQLLEKFKKEATCVVSLKHVNIPRAIYVEDTSDVLLCEGCGSILEESSPCGTCGSEKNLEINKRCYLLFEFIDGEDLEDKIKRIKRPLTESELRDWVLDISGALIYLHNSDRIHRDVKPDNIMVEKSTGRAYLLDFGLSISNSDAKVGFKANSIGNWGTRGYVPESFAGDREEICRDIYGFGMTIYRLLTNRNPKVETENKVLMSLRPREINPGISKRMEDIILRAIAQRKDSYSEIYELDKDLKELYKNRDKSCKTSLIGIKTDYSDVQQIKNLPSDKRIMIPEIGKDPVLNKGNSRKLTIAYNELYPGLDEKTLKVEFAKAFPMIRLEFKYIDISCFEEEILNRQNLGKPYDIIFTPTEYGIWESLRAKNIFEPVGKLIESEILPYIKQKETFIQHTGRVNRAEGVYQVLIQKFREYLPIYGVPLAMMPGGIFTYDNNQYEMLKRKEWTWVKFLEKTTNAKIIYYGKILIEIIAASEGLKVYDEDILKMSVVTDQWLRLLEVYCRAIKEGLKSGRKIGRQQKKSDVYISFLNDFLNYIRADHDGEKWYCTSLPIMGHVGGSACNFTIFSITKGSISREEVIAFLMLCLKQSIYNNNYGAYLENLDNYRDLFNLNVETIPKYNIYLYELFDKAINLILTGELETEEALSIINRNGQNFLNKFIRK
jgi:serine/threonine protein kinase